MRWLEQKFKEHFELKTEYLGPNSRRHLQQIRVLNRIISWGDDGILYEADQRHADILMRDLGIDEKAKSVTTPGSRDDAGKATELVEDEKEDLKKSGRPLTVEEAKEYRGLAARANYLSQDRPDVQYAVKEIARRMATPHSGDWGLLKRLARYLAGSPRAVYQYWWQSKPTSIETCTDSDWAGCKGSRRSTSGGVMLHGHHCVKSWSATQATVALSSAEAELYALLKGATQTLGMIALAADLGADLGAKVKTDASATLGIVSRQGLGKLRHIGVQYLWIQEKTRDGSIAVSKVAGTDNPADLLTKHLPAESMKGHMDSLGISIEHGRAGTAPRLDSVTKLEEGKGDEWREERDTVVREHVTPRRELFTPLRVRGAPPAKALTPTRVTAGRFVDNGEVFTRTDAWTSRATAHLKLDRDWTGTTTFLKRSDWTSR